MAAADTPLLIRGLNDSQFAGWDAMADRFTQSSLMAEFGDEPMKLSVGKLLSHGPESTKLDEKKLEFMKKVGFNFQACVIHPHPHGLYCHRTTGYILDIWRVGVWMI